MKYALVLIITFLTCSSVFGQSSQNDFISADLDSLLEVSNKQSGLEKVRTYVLISKKYSLQYFDKA